ncbi:hypothetical protein C0992_008357 [Termitomyces sp. T32_za158]|nr:hypothetical protein C0992_008357 [Termitomyces sp. T32_za158]
MNGDVQTYGFPPGYFIIRNLATHRVLDVERDQIEDGTEVILWAETETALVEKTGEISIHFENDPDYHNESQSDAWRSRSYLLTAIPLRKPKTMLDDAAAFLSMAVSTPLSLLSGVSSRPQATPDEVFRGPIDLDENEVVEEDRGEEAEVDDSPETGRKGMLSRFYLSTHLTPRRNASARFGPYAIRSASGRIRESSGYTVSWGSSPFDQGAKIIDCGDVRRRLFRLLCEFDLSHSKVPVTRFDNALAMDQIEVAYSTLLNQPTPGGSLEWKERTRTLSKDGLEHPRIVRQGKSSFVVSLK